MSRENGNETEKEMEYGYALENDRWFARLGVVVVAVVVAVAVAVAVAVECPRTTAPSPTSCERPSLK